MRRRMGLPAAAALLGALLAGEGPAAAGGDGSPDAPVLRRIDDLRGPASGLRLDGRARDWEVFPSFDDRDAAPVRDRSLDIVRTAVAPRDRDLLVLVETAAAPSKAPFAFRLEIDFLGCSAPDAAIRFGTSGPADLSVFPEGGKAARWTVTWLEAASADALEVRVPMETVAATLGGEDGKAWLRGERRSFVRVQAFTFAPGAAEPLDTGPAAASFRLAAPPFPLDPPLRPDGQPRRAVLLPVQGKWFVRQGAHGLWSHQGVWAYDLAVEDHALQAAPVPGSRRFEDYYAWGKPVIAPEPGTVVFDNDPVEDRAPLALGDPKGARSTGNTLIVRFGDGMRLLFGHLRMGAPLFPRGAAFEEGSVLARVGNSGDSGAPHLHLSLHERPGEFTGLPLAFRDVRVGLNPGPGDPWARDLPVWAVREGWFVEGR